MGIRRACSYQANIKTPEAPTAYSAILVTFQQKKENLINLGLDQLEMDEELVRVKLDQEQTAQFEAGVPAFLQIRCYKSQYEAPGSKIWTLDVYPALNDTILPESNAPTPEEV